MEAMMSINWKGSAAGLFAMAAMVCPAMSGAQSVCITNARIYTVSGSVIERGTIVVESGRIKAVGKDFAIPSDARVIDARGKCVMPGIVDANARFGISGDDNEQGSESTPDVRASNLYDPFSAETKRALQGGVTSACLTPGTSNSIGGLCSVVKTYGGTTVRDAIAERAALGNDVSARNTGFRGASGESLASIYTRRPNSRMGAVWELRYSLFEARRSPSMSRVVKGSLPLRIHARAENDIRVALTIADEFKLRRVILDDCVEAYKIPELIASHKMPVVLGPFYDAQGDLPEATEGCLNTAGILSNAGVKVALGSNGGDPAGLLTWAALAARGGMSAEAALRLLSLNAAEIVGVGDRIGSIQAGKDADLLILSGEPLDITSRVETVIVNGSVVHESK
jgi:imidazolonepropionase-like amidohydrolase